MKHKMSIVYIISLVNLFNNSFVVGDSKITAWSV